MLVVAVPGREVAARITRRGPEREIQMNATVLLANFAKVSDGMVDIQQGGWTQIGPGPVSFFVAGLVSCQWHETNQKHDLRVELLDADGGAVPHPENGEPILTAGTFEIGRPPGVKAGATIHMPIAVPFGLFELEAGADYEVRLTIDGEGRDEWRLPFTVREVPPQQVAA
jgi:hypothetical protein